jgi:hypothetical protein
MRYNKESATVTEREGKRKRKGERGRREREKHNAAVGDKDCASIKKQN